ncbi:MAG: DEAD/DEAH box helicase, partial [Syntrophobacteraceae bacterium]|nr:DEAD/DEAH box helicase [Syntrophobacteraceae bacterium]
MSPALERIHIPEPQSFVPDPFQVEALEALNRADVLVTAPTGAGKTYIAIEAIGRVYRENGRSWYASPLKALSNAKYEEFSNLFGVENVGILTGDRKENAQAPILVGTTEILRNQLYDMMHQGEDLPVNLVVLDEAHYLGDEDRGVVWEEVLIYLPSRVRLLLLSATIQNAAEICSWLRWIRGTPCEWVGAFERPVPLYPLFLFPNGELGPLSTRRGMYAKIRTVEPKSFSRKELPNVPRVMEVLREVNLLPAIFFLKSRADCEKSITLCVAGESDKSRPRPRRDGFNARLNAIVKEHPFLRQHQHLGILKSVRVGAHHGGQLPHWKLLLEKLMQEGHLDAIFSTSTVAAGVNFPARTVVIFQSDRFNGREFVDLKATDLLQMTGRAGRRGMDEIGFVLVLPGPYQNPQLIHELLRSSPDPILSQIRINFSMVLNLLLSHKPDEIRALFASSLATFQNLKQEKEISQESESLEREMEEWLPEMACGSMESLAEVRPQYAMLSEGIRKARRQWKRQASTDAFYGGLTPGRLFFSRRGTPYVVIAPQVERHVVVAVRLAHPLRSRRGRVRTHAVEFKRIRHLGEKLHTLPSLNRKKDWEALVEK